MANNWRLLKTADDIGEAEKYMLYKNEPIEILIWDEETRRAYVTEIDRNARYFDSPNYSLAWRPSEDEEKFKKFLAKLDRDFVAYVLEFLERAEAAKINATIAAIRESLKRELPSGEADYFVFSIIGYIDKVIILVDNAMSFDIPAGCVSRIQKTTPSYAAEDNDCFAKAFKEHREELEKRFFGDEEDD